jgi:glutathione S-transferase
MEDHLNGRQFLVAESYSIADIALFAYTHVAEEGGFDLTPYHNLKGWISRVQNAPGHIPIDQVCGS